MKILCMVYDIDDKTQRKHTKFCERFHYIEIIMKIFHRIDLVRDGHSDTDLDTSSSSRGFGNKQAITIELVLTNIFMII